MFLLNSGFIRVIVIAFLCLSAGVVSAQAPPPPVWQFKFGGKVTEFNEKKGKDIALEGAICTLLKGSTQVQSQTTSNGGKFKFVLDPNNEYTVTITKPGYITKKFSISTYNVPVERGEFPFAEFDIEVGLFKLFPGLDYSCLDKPVAKVSFNPAKDVDDFDYDKVYTASIQACIDKLRQLEAEARAKQKLYDAAIEAADKLFAQSNWQGAKDKYNEALTYLPNEQYPKDQIAKCDEKLGASAKLDADYKTAIAEGDRLFTAGDYAGAKAQYQKASALKVAEQYPKDRIVLCDQKIAEAGKQKQYDEAIAAADAKFKASDWAGAKAKYQEASGIKTTEQYPKDQIVKCDAELAKAGQRKQYDDAIAAADAKFKASDWSGAKADYQKASGILPAETYPKDQIVKCDAEIAKAGLQKQYDDAIAAADAKFKASDWAGAKADYQKASALKASEAYPKDQIVKCDAEIAKAGLQKQYDDAIAAADAKFKASDWAGAKADYQKASALKATEAYPKDQIVKCDAEIAKAGLQKQYDDAIAAADAKFKASDWTGAKADYQKASALKSAEQYPKDQIVKCDAEIAKAGTQKSYDAAIAAADAKFKASDWAGAKAKYEEASKLKTEEKYPKDQIVICDENIKKAGLDKQYNDAIAAADAKFKTSDWSGAKAKYQEASALKTAEQYPKDQIAKCDENLGKAEIDKQYKDAIAAADAKFKAADWNGAKADYQKASDIKSSEQYPKDQMAKCDANLAKAGVDKQYNDLIADADAKFKAADYAGAKSVYQKASDVKTAEKYPKDQMAKCDAELAKQGVQKQYDDAIAAADAKFKSSDWAGAKADYQRASALKTLEKYPKDQIIICDKNIAGAEKDKQYSDLIAQADDKFKASDWAGAKSLYQQAAALKAAEVYPKDQIKICDANISKQGKDKQYADLIAKADEKFAAKDWAGAKAIYLQATAVKAEEQYPKDKAAECDKNMQGEKDAKYNAIISSADSLFKLSDYSAAKVKYKEASTARPAEVYPKDKMKECDDMIAKMGKDKQYADLISKADAKFAAKDWVGAKALYVQASGVKTEEAYPKDKAAECDKNMQGEKDAKYNAIIASADSLFKLSDYSAAKVKYKEASTARPAEVYPKDKIKECDDLIAKSGKDKQYSDLIAKADDKFKAEDYAAAKPLYTQASAVKAEEQYPKDQIKICDEKLALAGTEKKYADLIKQADTKFGASDWAGAKTLYTQASAVKTAEQYPKDQIAKCDENIAKSGTDKSYNAAIAAADAKFKLSDWAGAKSKYEEALSIKSGEAYPADQIKKCDENIAAAANKKYNDAIAAADTKFNASDWAGAKKLYQDASGMRPTEQYPKDKIAACDENIAKSGLDKNYNALIAAADQMFKSSAWAGAKAKYQEALALKSAEQYPKDQIAICDQKIAEAEGLDVNYSRAIAKGDSAFKVEDYETAKSRYEYALTLKPGQAYPKAQIDEINKRLAAINAGNAKDAKYRTTIATADSLFNAKDYAGAKAKYQDASTQKPSEAYPKDRFGECQRLLADQALDAAKQKRYDDLIKKADAKFAASDWAGAKKLYQDALKEKPMELYPKQKINECDKKLNPVAVKDTARTPEQIKEDYRNEVARTYPQGLTTVEEKDGGTTTIKRIVVIGDKGYVYTKKSYSWGTFYFKDGVQISEGTFNYETSPGYIQQEQQKVQPK
jgi:hypothetical protein